jgi:hypothetical protein
MEESRGTIESRTGKESRQRPDTGNESPETVTPEEPRNDEEKGTASEQENINEEDSPMGDESSVRRENESKVGWEFCVPAEIDSKGASENCEDSSSKIEGRKSDESPGIRDIVATFDCPRAAEPNKVPEIDGLDDARNDKEKGTASEPVNFQESNRPV